ncbi:hypothetical protein RN001_000129 [Aquatica leii]|uniref:Uncharacterized protein n=1 Tax=Aquatica leii TaxID=1421715 RepID=A0AAN7SQG3_9COLE|nr:hypothetical protein RN001_000129 [Aquatica leii]
MDSISLNRDNSTELNSANVARLTNLFKLNTALKGVVIDKLRITACCDNSTKEFSHLQFVSTFGLDFKVDIDITVPRIRPLSNECGDINKMKIYVHDSEIRNEVRSFTNYLQRRKNLNLTIVVLKKLALSVADRKLIVDMLYLHTEGNIRKKIIEDGGISIICKVHEIKYFKCDWKIHLDCSDHQILDIIDFTVTKKDTVFYKSVLNSINYLVRQNLSYQTKINYWTVITDMVNTKMKEPVIEIIENDSWDQKDYLLVRNLAEVDNGVMEQYEILEPDNEDCHIIDN